MNAKKKNNKSVIGTIVVILIVLIVVAGLPIGFLEYQSEKTGKTWSQIIEKFFSGDDESEFQVAENK